MEYVQLDILALCPNGWILVSSDWDWDWGLGLGMRVRDAGWDGDGNGNGDIGNWPVSSKQSKKAQ